MPHFIHLITLCEAIPIDCYLDHVSIFVLSIYYISSQMKYDTSLSKQIEVIIIEEVDLTDVGTDIDSIRKKLKEREWNWQNNLNTLRQYGGLNVREERS